MKTLNWYLDLHMVDVRLRVTGFERSLQRRLLAVGRVRNRGRSPISTELDDSSRQPGFRRPEYAKFHFFVCQGAGIKAPISLIGATTNKGYGYGQ